MQELVVVWSCWPCVLMLMEVLVLGVADVLAFLVMLVLDTCVASPGV